MCKVMDFKNETILMETNFCKSKIMTSRPIKWEEIDLPKEWVIEEAAPPRKNKNVEISVIDQTPDGTVNVTPREGTLYVAGT